MRAFYRLLKRPVAPIEPAPNHPEEPPVGQDMGGGGGGAKPRGGNEPSPPQPR